MINWSNISIEELLKRMQHGRENITINRHKKNPVDAVQSITRVTSLQAYGIEREKAKNTKREHKTTSRNLK